MTTPADAQARTGAAACHGLRWLIALVGLLTISSSAVAQEPGAPAQPAPALAAKHPDNGYLRIVETPGSSIELQVAARTFVRDAAEPAVEPRAGAPSVTLVAVAHVGEAALYQSLQRLLDGHDVVLYESVKPPGAGGAGGATPEERIESTRAAMRFVAGLLEAHHRDRESYPACLSDLTKYAEHEDSRLGAFLVKAQTDAWGRTLIYSLTDESFELRSLGADGVVGGDGENADLGRADLGPIEAHRTASDDGLQSELARTLGLQFQLDAIDYDRPNWRCSDMAMDQLDRAMQAQGVEFAPMRGTLAGSSLPARMIKMLLGMIRLADRFAGGSVVDMIKVMLIEMLGDESITEQALAQFGPGMGEVLINQRNQLVIDDLKALLQKEPNLKSVAVFYGAGHMPDFAARMTDQLGYRQQGEPTWTTAIRIDLERSQIDPAELRQMRFMLRRAIRTQMQQQRQGDGHAP